MGKIATFDGRTLCEGHLGGHADGGGAQGEAGSKTSSRQHGNYDTPDEGDTHNEPRASASGC